MFKVVRYRVQAFRKTLAGLVPAGAQEFREEAAARTLGAALGKTADGLVVVRIEGEPMNDIWREPRVLASYGVVPDLA